MKTTTSKAYSISKIIDNNVLFSKTGTISMLYELKQPEKYSLSEKQFDERINEFFMGLKGMPRETYFHKQDVYLVEPFDTSEMPNNLYLDRALKKHFEGRTGVNHYCIIAFVITGLNSLSKSYNSNPFEYSKNLEKDDRTRLLEFEASVRKSISVFNNNIYNTEIIPLNEIDVRQHLYKYVNGFETGGLYDIDFRDRSIGTSKFDMFSFSKAEFFPNTISNIRRDELSREEFTIHTGFMDMIGESFKTNHVYNQIIYFEGTRVIQNELEFRKDEYGKVRSLNESINQQFLKYEDYLKEISKDENEIILVKSNFNLVLLNKNEEKLEKASNKLKEILDTTDIKFYNPSKEVLKDLFLGSIIGRESHLHKDHFFISNLKESLFLMTNTTNPKNDKKGVYFNDRINQLPLRRDLWDEEQKRISARNGIIVANTGGGKSVVALNIIMQFLSQGINAVVAEFGNSFKFITKLYPDISAHFEYSSEKPLGINPFKLSAEGVTKDKLSLLTEIVMKTWRVPGFIKDAHVGVSMNKLIKHYYEKQSHDHSYKGFYFFIIKGGKALLDSLEINTEYFDIESFRHICSEFIEGGKYENVFKESDFGVSLIREKQFVVFELTEIKKDPFLVTLILLILQDTIDTNILSDRSKKGILIFDEFAETQAMKDIYSDTEVLATVAILFQKIRKENGAVWIIIQDPIQLPKNDYTGGIIANSKITIVLPSETTTYTKIEQTFGLTKHQGYQMRSIKSNKNAKHPYTEQWIRIGDESFITRLELSREAFFAFQTDGEVWDELNKKYNEINNMPLAIDQLIKQEL